MSRSGGFGGLPKAASDAGIFVSTSGSDAANGLTPGTAKATLSAALDALPSSGGTISLGSGIHRLPSTITASRNRVRVVGAGRPATSLIAPPGAPLIQPSTVIQNWTFSDIELRGNGGHIFDLGTNGGLANCQILRASMFASDGYSIISGSGTCQLIGTTFRDVLMTRTASATTPAIQLVSSAGSLNSNVFDTITMYGNGCTSSPFVYIEATLGSYAHDNLFSNIIGENNLGGLLHVYSPNGLTLDSVVDWDSTAPYAADLVRIDTSPTSGRSPRGVVADNVGTRYGTMGAGCVQLRATNLTADAVCLSRIGDPNQSQPSQTISRVIPVSIRDASGATGCFRESVTNLTLSHATDGTVLFSGSTALTATLPASTSVPYFGRTFRIINGTTQNLTVASADGKLIAGAASQTLTAGAFAGWAYYNGAWYRVL